MENFLGPKVLNERLRLSAILYFFQYNLMEKLKDGT